MVKEYVNKRMDQIIEFLKSHKKSITSFLIVGGLAAVINFSSFTVMWKLINLPYQAAISIAFLFSVLFHFNANRMITFKSHGANLHFHIVKYICLILINYTVTLIVVHIVVEILHLSPYVGIICSILTNLSSNYLLSRFWVFTH